jgi:predicted RNase H-like HicB family nuclease
MNSLEEVLRLTKEAISNLERAKLRLENPEGPPYRGDIQVLLKDGSNLAKEAWQLYKKIGDP